MENETLLNNIPAQFGENASIKKVFGEPIRAGDKVIIPVAQVAFGFGAGFGKGNKKGKADKKADDSREANGEGGGGGGGMFARAKGIFVITPKSEKYISVSNSKHIILGLAIGFLLRGFLGGRKK